MCLCSEEAGCMARKKIEDIESSKVYTCGSFLFPPDSDYSSTIVIRQALTCQDPIVAFPPVCFHCGAPEETLLNNAGSRAPQQQTVESGKTRHSRT